MIDGLTFSFVLSHFFPEKEVLRKEFNFSFKRIDPRASNDALWTSVSANKIILR